MVFAFPFTTAGLPLTVGTKTRFAAELEATIAALMAYVPDGNEVKVVVSVSVCEKLSGPVTMTLPTSPDGSPVTFTVSDPDPGTVTAKFT